MRIGEISEAERRPEFRTPLPAGPGAYRGGYAPGQIMEKTDVYIQPGAIVINAPTREAEGIKVGMYEGLMEALQAAGQQ